MLTDEDKTRIEEEEKYRAKVRQDIGTTDPNPKKKGKGCLTLIGIVVAASVLFKLMGSPSNTGNKNLTPNAEVESAKVESPDNTTDSVGNDTISADVVEYSSEMATIMQNVADAMNNLSVLAGEWPDWSDEDTISFAASGLVLQNSYKNALELTPPPVMESVHTTALKGLKLWSDSVPILNSGIDNYDAAKILEATEMLEEGTTYIKDATGQLNEITAKMEGN